jgi:hypothetical protein
MTPPAATGRIVWAEIADANGVRKLRPAVIVTPADRITSAGPFEVVAITSRLPQPLPDDHILLPWHPQGHPRSGLNRRCAAVCGWVARIAAADIRAAAGMIPNAALALILAKLAASIPPPPSGQPPASSP